MVYITQDRSTSGLTLKVSSHFRAWARAIIEQDAMMLTLMSRFQGAHVQYQGATLLTTSFNVRIQRHREDVFFGKTTKEEAKRFMNHNEEFFSLWDKTLQQLMTKSIYSVQTICTDSLSVNQTAALTMEHIQRVQDG